MKKKLVSLLSVAVLGCFGLPAWSQSNLPPSDNTGIFPVSAQTVAPAPATTAPAVDPSATCGPNCANDPPLGSFVFGGGLYFMTPYYQNGVSGFPGRGSFDPSTGITYRNNSGLSQSMEAAPLAWLGYVFENGWGVRARWFEFSGTTSVNAPSFDNIDFPGQSQTISQHLGVNVIDFEATNNFKCGCWSILVSAGIRIADISQSVNYDDYERGILSDYDHYHANFKGIGPTLSIEVRRQIINTDFALYGSARGSILFGSKHLVEQLPGEGDETVVDEYRATTVVGIGELEIGGEWSRCMGRYTLTAQLGLAAQIWLGGDQTTFVDQGISGGFGGNFGFFGGVARIGVSF